MFGDMIWFYVDLNIEPDSLLRLSFYIFLLNYSDDSQYIYPFFEDVRLFFECGLLNKFFFISEES